MAKNYAKCELQGQLVKDYEIQAGKTSGKLYGKFTVAVNTGRDANKKTNFIDCTAFGDIAEKLATIGATKGKCINVLGNLDINSWVDKNGVSRKTPQIVVREADMVGKDKEMLEPENIVGVDETDVLF